MDFDPENYDLDDLFITTRDPILRAFNRLVFKSWYYQHYPRAAKNYLRTINQIDRTALKYITRVEKRIDAHGITAVRQSLKYKTNS